MKRMKHMIAGSLLAFVFLAGGLNLSAQTCPTGMLAYYKLQELTGPSYLDSQGGHDAFAPSSSPIVTGGISGSAQMFSSANSSYLSIPDHSDFDWGGGQSFSVEFWVKYSGSGAVRVFVGRDETSSQMQWWIGTTVTGSLTWFLQSSNGDNKTITTDAPFNNGSWHHVVAVRDGSVGRNYLYVDGTLQNIGGDIFTTGGSFASSSPITLGCLAFNNNPDYFANAAMDEVAIYNRALNVDDDIIPHYNNLRLYQIGYCDGEEANIISTPVIEAVVGQAYNYDVDASGNSLPTYKLITGPQGMTIDAVTGLISWTPTSISQNGRVVVEASNDKGSVTQEFNVYIADVPNCRSNLIAYWDFDDSGSPYYDKVSSYMMTGTAPVTVPGLVGNALMFDGVNDSINMQDNFNGSDNVFFDFDDVPNWSIELWFKTSHTWTANTPMVMVGREVTTNQTQFWIGLNNDGSITYFGRDWEGTNTTIEGGSGLNDNNWHHVVVAYSDVSRNIRLYIDNVEEDQASVNFYNFGGGAPLNIAHLNAGGSNKYWFKGSIDELAFYNNQLSTNQVNNNYSQGRAGLGACVFNHAPVIESTPETTVNQGDDYTYDIVASEIDINDVLTITAPVKPDWLTLTAVPGADQGQLSGNPTNDEVGMHDVTIRVSDGAAFVDQSFVIEVVNVNDLPVITSSPLLEIDQNANYTYVVEATDADGDELQYSAPIKPASFDFDAETRTLSGTPTQADVGMVDITIRVSDGTDQTDQVFQITVNDVNDAPVFTTEPLTEVFQGEEYRYTVVATDPEGDDVTVTATELPGWMTFNANLLSGTTENIGVYNVKLTATDGTLSSEQVFQVEVKNVNDPPVVTSTAITSARVGETYLYQIDVTDEDIADNISFSAESMPAWLSFIPASNSAILSGTPTASDYGNNAVIIKVSDGTVDIVHAFTIFVNGPVGITDQQLDVLQVYPNPASDVAYIKLSERMDVRVEVLDNAGVVHKQFSSENEDLIKIDVSDLQNNVYYYRLIVDDRSIVGKLVVE